MMQAFCRSLPKDRLLNQDDAEVDKIFDFDGGKRTYTIQSTGAKLTYKHAIQVLSRYAESLVSLAYTTEHLHQ